MKNPNVLYKLAVLFILFGLGCGGIVPTSSDADEASAICLYVEKNFKFETRSKRDDSRPPIYRSPGTQCHTLIIYTVTDKKQQDEILDLVRNYKKQNKTKPVTVKFYVAENFKLHMKNGMEAGGHREKETLIRTKRVW